MNKNNVKQFIKFCVVGVSNTLISYVINIIVLCVLQPLNVNWDFFLGNLTAFLLSVLWSFYWNNKYVFTSKKDEFEKDTKKIILYKLLKTYLAYGFTGIILCNVLSYIWINVFKISKMIAPLINLIVSVPLNFIINKIWTFREY